MTAQQALDVWLRAFRCHMPTHFDAAAPRARDCAGCRDLMDYFNDARAWYGPGFLASGRREAGRALLYQLLDQLEVLP